MKLRHLFAIWGCVLAVHSARAQKTQQQPVNIGGSFLLVNPDAKSSGAGDAITGLAPDANTLFANAAKIPFAGEWGVSASYSPLMWDLNDHKTNTAYVSAFKNWNGREGAGIS